MKEVYVVASVASVIIVCTGLYHFGRPFMYRRNLRIAEDEVKVLRGRYELSDISKSTETKIKK